MITVNSISGGKTSAYIAKNYPADYNIFALVTTNDKKCLYPDKKIRQIVSDKIGREFIGTLEMDVIIRTLIELEQFIGSEIKWVSGLPFDEIIKNKGGYLPNVLHRYCTTHLKMEPIFNWWRENINEVVDMRIGFRANETSRANKMLDKLNKDGISEMRAIVGRTKTGTQNAWADVPWRVPTFPLITDLMYKDNIDKYWIDKPVPFAELNNCVGCFHRSPILLKKMSDTHSNKMDWFADQEGGDNGYWRKDKLTYKDIRNSLKQIELNFEDFNTDEYGCDSGECGI
tara:strand:+ start:13340 stop:14197 length:858 start_codon:yes stop_codon:yes gene_type:complete